MFTFLLSLLNKVVSIQKHWYFRFVIVFPALTGNLAAIQEFGEVLNKIKNFSARNGVSLKSPAEPVVEVKDPGCAVVRLATGYEISVYRVFTDQGTVRQVIHFPAASVPLGELLYLIAGLDAAIKTAGAIR